MSEDPRNKMEISRRTQPAGPFIHKASYKRNYHRRVEKHYTKHALDGDGKPYKVEDRRDNDSSSDNDEADSFDMGLILNLRKMLE